MIKKNKEKNDNGVEKKELTPKQLQKRKKMLIFPLLFLLFAGSMWLIFAPSSEEKEKAGQQTGFNADLPMPKEEGIVSDKRDAYEQEAIKQKEEDKKRSLQDFAFILGEENSSYKEDEYKHQPRVVPKQVEYYEGTPRSHKSAIHSSANAYQDINRQLGAWYEQPAVEVNDQSQLEMEFRIQELERKLEEEELRKKMENEQLSMIEKSYQLAAKYMPGSNEQQATDKTEISADKNNKIVTQSVKQVKSNVVSSLSTPMSNDEFVEQFSRPRNIGFLTAIGNEDVTDKNSIGASVYQTVTVTSGKEVHIRLTEPMLAGNFRIPAGTILTGICRITGDRLDINVTVIQYAGNIIHVELNVYDTDGQRGIFVPNSDEITATKEIAANLGSSAGNSIMISDNAGSQLAADLGKGLIQGASQYVSKKMQEVKVTLKAGYRVLLLPKNE